MLRRSDWALFLVMWPLAAAGATPFLMRGREYPGECAFWHAAGSAVAAAVVVVMYARDQRRAEQALAVEAALWTLLRASGRRVEATVTYTGCDLDGCYNYVKVSFVAPAGTQVNGESRWQCDLPLPAKGAVIGVLILPEGNDWELEANVLHGTPELKWPC